MASDGPERRNGPGQTARYSLGAGAAAFLGLAVAALLLGACRGGAWQLAPGETRVLRDYEPGEFVVALSTSHRLRHIELRDARSGTLRATVGVGDYPLALQRAAAGELLVSELLAPYVGGADPPRWRLLVFDTTDGLAIKREIEMPGRAMYTIYYPGMVLSGDQRYLFYRSRDVECGGGCDEYSIRVIDLDTGAPATAPILPPAGKFCRPSLDTAGPHSVIATCESRMQLIDASGAVLAEDILSIGGARRTAEGELLPRRETFGFVRPDGGLARVLSDGTVIWRDADGEVQAALAIPNRAQWIPCCGFPVQRVNAELLAVGYQLERDFGSTGLDGFALFDVSAMRVVRDFPFEWRATSVAVRPDGTISVLWPRGEIRVFEIDGNGDRLPFLGPISLAEIWVLIP